MVKERILRYKQSLKIVVLVWGILIILFLIKLFQAVLTVSQSAELIGFPDTTEVKSIPVFQEKEAFEINKQINWLEQQLLLAKTDSLTLGINLLDSTLSIQLKGYALFQTKIIKQEPHSFLSELSPPSYYHIFGKPLVINSESSNIPKKPIKKVVVQTGIGVQSETESPLNSDDRFHWKFSLDNNITLVLNGMTDSKDSVSNFFYTKDILKNNFEDFLKNPVNGNNNLTLFLWVPDNEARAIYRALPEKAKVLFLN